MQRQYLQVKKTPPSWWVRCAVMALACIMVVTPTWHICPEGAADSAHGHDMAMGHQACATPQSSHTQSHSGHDSAQLQNQPVAADFCLAKLLQHVLGNNQYHLVLDFSAVTVSTLTVHPADIPLIRALPVTHARGPPSYLH